MLALSVLFLLKAIYVLAGLVTTVGSYILSPLVLFILVFAIWSATQREWTDVILPGGLEILIIAAAFAAVRLTDLLLRLSDGLARFLHVQYEV